MTEKLRLESLDDVLREAKEAQQAQRVREIEGRRKFRNLNELEETVRAFLPLCKTKQYLLSDGMLELTVWLGNEDPSQCLLVGLAEIMKGPGIWTDTHFAHPTCAAREMVVVDASRVVIVAKPAKDKALVQTRACIKCGYYSGGVFCGKCKARSKMTLSRSRHRKLATESGVRGLLNSIPAVIPGSITIRAMSDTPIPERYDVSFRVTWMSDGLEIIRNLDPLIEGRGDQTKATVTAGGMGVAWNTVTMTMTRDPYNAEEEYQGRIAKLGETPTQLAGGTPLYLRLYSLRIDLAELLGKDTPPKAPVAPVMVKCLTVEDIMYQMAPDVERNPSHPERGELRARAVQVYEETTANAARIINEAYLDSLCECSAGGKIGKAYGWACSPWCPSNGDNNDQ